jgi:hypothetical protein
MNEMQGFAQNVDEVLGLVREAINNLVAEDNKKDRSTMETQLREISRAIENLEKKCIFVPDVLRAEKTRLAAAVEVQSEAAVSLGLLINGLENIVREFKPSSVDEMNKQSGRRTRSRAPKTSNAVLRELIIEALRYYGGSAPKRQVHKYIGESLNDKFLPGDLAWRKASRNLVWQNNTDWERNNMKNDGIIKHGSPTGVWELSEEYR